MSGRLSIREDEPTKIIASNIREMTATSEEIKKVNVNITDFSENKKEELRQAIRYYSKMSNAETEIEVTINGEIKPCGKIFFNREIEKLFIEKFGKDKVLIVKKDN